MTNGSQDQATTHLKRAHRLIKGVEEALEQFRSEIASHDSGLDHVSSVGDFIQGLQGARAIKQKKAALISDLDLASSEVGRAATLEPSATVETPDGQFGVPQLQALVLLERGELEMTAGTAAEAKRLVNESIQILELPYSHFVLGAVHESEYNPIDAIKHYQRYLDLDPDGELCVPALKAVKALSSYKKAFRGSWGTFWLLMLFCWPVAPFYYFRNRK